MTTYWQGPASLLQFPNFSLGLRSTKVSTRKVWKVGLFLQSSKMPCGEVTTKLIFPSATQYMQELRNNGVCLANNGNPHKFGKEQSPFQLPVSTTENSITQHGRQPSTRCVGKNSFRQPLKWWGTVHQFWSSDKRDQGSCVFSSVPNRDTYISLLFVKAVYRSRAQKNHNILKRKEKDVLTYLLHAVDTCMCINALQEQTNVYV